MRDVDPCGLGPPHDFRRIEGAKGLDRLGIECGMCERDRRDEVRLQMGDVPHDDRHSGAEHEDQHHQGPFRQQAAHPPHGLCPAQVRCARGCGAHRQPPHATTGIAAAVCAQRERPCNQTCPMARRYPPSAPLTGECWMVCQYFFTARRGLQASIGHHHERADGGSLRP
jgi:hypothetical protein